MTWCTVIYSLNRKPSGNKDITRRLIVQTHTVHREEKMPSLSNVVEQKHSCNVWKDFHTKIGGLTSHNIRLQHQRLKPIRLLVLKKVLFKRPAVAVSKRPGPSKQALNRGMFQAESTLTFVKWLNVQTEKPETGSSLRPKYNWGWAP